MPLAREDWPVSEGLGVLVSILGVDWLIDGQTSILPALAIALGSSIVILAWRRRRKPGAKQQH